MKTNRILKMMAVTLAMALAVTLALPGTVEAASSKAVKSVSVKIGTKKVAKKTYSLSKGMSVSLKVSANPVKAKKSVSFKSSNKKVATVSKKGRVTAKKTGTAKITVTVKGKNGKKKTTYVKMKVIAKKSTAKKNSSNPQTSSVNGHKHKWVNITETQRVYVVDSQAWDQDVYASKCVCHAFGNQAGVKCGLYFDTYEELCQHQKDTGHGSYRVEDVFINTIHHSEKGHYENRIEIIDRKCSICGMLDSQL